MMSNEQKKEPVTGTPAEKAADEAAKTAQDAAEALQNLAAAVDPAAKTAPAGCAMHVAYASSFEALQI